MLFSVALALSLDFCRLIISYYNAIFEETDNHNTNTNNSNIPNNSQQQMLNTIFPRPLKTIPQKKTNPLRPQK